MSDFLRRSELKVEGLCQKLKFESPKRYVVQPQTIDHRSHLIPVVIRSNFSTFASNFQGDSFYCIAVVSFHELIDQIDKDRLPQHVAIIMDGNGRWQRER